MTDDKRRQLEALRDKLLGVYVDEVDPDNWISEEKAKKEAADILAADPGDKDAQKEARKVLSGWKGERYWEKKNANQTGALLVQIERILEVQPPAAGEDDEREREKKEIRKMEREAKKRLARTRPTLIQGGKK